MYYLTFDQDWAPAWATLDVAQALSHYGLEGTLFVTQNCPSLPELRRQGHVELGWHPNFLPGSSHGASWDEVLDTLAAWVPEAKGVRAHCLIRGTPLLTKYRERGLVYDASDLHDGQTGLRPFSSWTGITRLPIWWEDDVVLRRGLPMSFVPPGPPDGLRVINVHPVLHALNATDFDCYESLKAYLRDQGRGLIDATREDIQRFKQSSGVADWLNDMMEWLGTNEAWAGGKLIHAVARD